MFALHLVSSDKDSQTYALVYFQTTYAYPTLIKSLVKNTSSSSTIGI